MKALCPYDENFRLCLHISPWLYYDKKQPNIFRQIQGGSSLRIRVHYVSPKGSAEQVAEAIARAVKCVKEPLLPAYMPENVKLMFLGCEGNKADKVTMDFIASLTPNRVANAALFHCGKDQQALSQMRKALNDKGIQVLDMTLTTPLKGLFGGGPTQADLERARQFAEDCVHSLT